MKRFINSLAYFLLMVYFVSCQGRKSEFPSMKVVPNEYQLAYQQMEMIGFIHFTVNTFTDQEWGFGDEKPAIFNPVDLDAEQWVLAAKSAGMKELILTAKHHDGFCLWPSAYTEHSVKNSPYKDGKGDIVREFSEACRKHGLKVGLYLSPWDRNHEAYGSPEYIEYYRNQLRELLTQYGEISEIWFDGANGGTGYYGGANEARNVDRSTYYDWPSTFALVKELQPGVQIFSDAGPDIHWIGNEHGFAGETFWSTIKNEELVIGASDPAYLNTGDKDGDKWIIGQCDVSIRPGWFYHEDEDAKVKTLPELMEIYYKSVGRNGLLLLNLPPDQRGLIHENDLASLRAFGKHVSKTFSTNLARGAEVKLLKNNSFNRHHKPYLLTDGDNTSFWAAHSALPSVLEISLDKETAFNVIELCEPIAYGQRIDQFFIEIEDENGKWREVASATTIGYKRLIKIEDVQTSRLRLHITQSLDIPALSEFRLYKEEAL